MQKKRNYLPKKEDLPIPSETEKKAEDHQPEYSIGMNYDLAKKLNFSPSVLEILENGWNPEVLPHGRCLNLKNNKSAYKWPEQMKIEIDNLLKRGRIEQVKKEDLHDINPLTMVYKPGKWRVCIDTSRIINKTIPSRPFKQRGLTHRLKNFKAGSWLAKIDLKNGYLHIPLHKDFRKYTGFTWNNKFYRYKWLPFGLNDAPRVFQAIANEVSLSLLQEGILVENYLDDFWIEAESKEKCAEAIKKTLKRLNDIGFTPNIKKSVLDPTQELEYLGVIFDTRNSQARLKGSAIDNIKRSFKEAIRRPTAKNLQKMLGFIVPALQLDHRLKPLTMKTYHQLGGKQYEELVFWTSSAISDIDYLIGMLPYSYWKAENSFKEKITITSDASKKGFAFWDDYTQKDTQILWNTNKHSTWTELKAALTALKQRSKKNFLNIIRTDNTTTRDILLSGSSKNDKLNNMVKEFTIWCIKNEIFFTATYIKGELNTRADKLSRDKKNNKESHVIASNKISEDSFLKKQPPGGMEFMQHDPNPQLPTPNLRILIKENIKESISTIPQDVILKQRKLFTGFPTIKIEFLLTILPRKIDKLYRKLLNDVSLNPLNEFIKFFNLKTIHDIT